jgi:hypothetical protein
MYGGPLTETTITIADAASSANGIRAGQTAAIGLSRDTAMFTWMDHNKIPSKNTSGSRPTGSARDDRSGEEHHRTDGVGLTAGILPLVDAGAATAPSTVLPARALRARHVAGSCI